MKLIKLASKQHRERAYYIRYKRRYMSVDYCREFHGPDFFAAGTGAGAVRSGAAPVFLEPEPEPEPVCGPGADSGPDRSRMLIYTN